MLSKVPRPEKSTLLPLAARSIRRKPRASTDHCSTKHKVLTMQITAPGCLTKSQAHRIIREKHTSMSTMHTLLHLPKPEGFIMQVFRMGAQTLCICSISPWQAESHGASSKPRLMAVQQLASKRRTAKPLEGSHPAERPLDQGKASKSQQGFVLLAVSQSQGDSGLLCLYTTAAIPAAAKLQSERDHTDCRELYSWKFLTFSPAPVYAQYRKQTLIVILYSFKKGWTTVNSSPVCPKSQILQQLTKQTLVDTQPFSCWGRESLCTQLVQSNSLLGRLALTRQHKTLFTFLVDIELQDPLQL